MALTNAQMVAQLYIAYFNRTPDTDGYSYWLTALNNGASYSAIAQSMTTSPEYKTLYPVWNTNTQYVTSIYSNVFGRTPDASGLAFWVNAMNTGAVTNSTLMLQMLTAANNAGNTDTTTLLSKTSFAQYAAENYIPTATATPYLAGATTAAASTAAQGAVANAGGINGNTYNLTTGIDSYTGTQNNDLFQGALVDVATAANSTLTGADIINGAGGTQDTLTITVNEGNNTNALNGATISNIEVINLKNLNTTNTGRDAELDASAAAGLTRVNANQSSAAVTVTNLASGATVGIVGNGSVANGASAFDFVAGATTTTLNFVNGTSATAGAANNAGDVTLTGTGLTSLTINSTGAANTINALTSAASVTSTTVAATTNLTLNEGFTSTNLTTLTLSGAGAINMGTNALGAAVTTVNASANTGGVTVMLGTNIAQVVTGGTGNDTFVVGNVALDTGSVNAGAGTNTLKVTSTNALASSTLGAKYTGFSVLNLGVAGAANASYVTGITSLVLSTDINNTISGLSATQAAAITVAVDQTSLVLTPTSTTGSTDVVSLTLNNTTDATAVAVAGFSIAGVETLNVATADGHATTNSQITLAASGATTLSAVNITGTAGFTFATGGNTTVAMVVDATALTNDFVTTGAYTTGSTIKGSLTVGNSFTVGATGSTYIGGAGNDDFIVTTSAILAGSTLTGGTGTDSLSLTGGQTYVDANFVNVTGMETVTIATSANAVNFTGQGYVNTAFATSLGLTATSTLATGGASSTVDLSLYTKNATVSFTNNTSTGAAAGDSITILTGAGTDSVTVSATSWVGAAAAAAGTISVSTGAGADTISITTGVTMLATTNAPVIVTGGTGADSITYAGHTTNVANNAGAELKSFQTVVSGATSDSTISAYDTITGFVQGSATAIADGLNFDSVSTYSAISATAVPGYSAAQLTIAVAAFNTGTNAAGAGLVTFAGTSAASLTVAEKLAAIALVVTADGYTCYFNDTASNAAYIFNSETTGSDSVVKLAGVTLNGLIGNNDAAASGNNVGAYIF